MTILLNNDCHEQWIATATHSGGDLVQTPSGKVGIILSSKPVEVGDKVTAERRGLIEIANPDSVTFAQGAQVGYDATDKKVTAAGAGDFDIGMIAKAYAVATNPVQLFLNES